MAIFVCFINAQKSIFDNQHFNFLRKFDAVALKALKEILKYLVV